MCFIFIYSIRPKFEIICKRNVKGRVEEIYTIENLPFQSKNIESIIYEYTNNFPFPNENCTRIFIERNWKKDYSLMWGKELDYDQSSCTVQGINTKIAVVQKYRLSSGKDTIEYQFFYW